MFYQIYLIRVEDIDSLSPPSIPISISIGMIISGSVVAQSRRKVQITASEGMSHYFFIHLDDLTWGRV